MINKTLRFLQDYKHLELSLFSYFSGNISSNYVCYYYKEEEEI